MNKQRKKAVALRYDKDRSHSPKIVATGKGLVAESVIEKAKESNVPILQDESLVEILAELNINETIPEELYEAVAEVFAFVYKADQAIANKKT